jgi:hypothetical protein
MFTYCIYLINYLIDYFIDSLISPSKPFNLSRNSSTEKESFLRVRARTADAAAAASLGMESIVPGPGCWGEEPDPFDVWGVPGWRV